MLLPPLPENETARLAELKNYSFLDTLPEKDLDDLTRLASEICQTPIALIGLIDEKRQWYKSKVGIDGNEVQRELSFCSYALLDTSSILEVADSRQDERFKDNPSVTGPPNVIFYAGVPLVTTNGYALGTLCVIDDKVRKLSDSQRNSLWIIANQIIQLFELRRSIRLLKETEKRLSESNEEMKAFTYTVSHDLRTPLRSINSYASILLQDHTSQLDEEARQMCGRMSSEAKRMGNLIDDLLTFTRLNQSPLKIVPIDMTQLASQVFRKISAPLEPSKIDFKTAALPAINGDPFMIELVWQNLIDNAIKFSSMRAHPVIEIGSENRGNKDVYFIRDNGAGFDMKYVHKLFGVFERLYGLHEFDGTGVGLAIIKRIVERHGGRIWAEGEPGKGATFYFTINEGK
ncbi:MAG: hypothetical protein C0523_05510 [Cytophaga sp.]|nr:hypothetical protein [Cytophaga sp.]